MNLIAVKKSNVDNSQEREVVREEMISTCPDSRTDELLLKQMSCEKKAYIRAKQCVGGKIR